ncbi:hypothetical protein H072_9009 [Dactylellina haptotyla CBS 200.50]|uniref:AGC-kinase C-terminal domain-containing protein n=1 Tax=Dactylellina haptotyla (strain CBS 200.50) TaxID=1284197 RepID=S8BQ18_DACHA|nr:hypothetical protein H072_9009 [Dactylellina haptotyla CBS 200.50]
MSFLRALSSDSLSGGSKSTTSQGSSSNTNITSAHHQNPPLSPHNVATGSGHRRHHAKALLNPMSLLLRRRSGQSSNVNTESATGSYGHARDLPDDFDPGIIYGTRHPDWSFPRRSTAQPTGQIRQENGIYGKTTGSLGKGAPQHDVLSDTSHIRNRQALFTEHFSDLDTLSPGIPDRTSLSTVDNPSGASAAEVSPESGTDTLGFSSVDSQAERLTNLSKLHDSTLQLSTQGSSSLTGAQGAESRIGLPVYQENDSSIPLDPLLNSSRFSFEASSAANSIHGEELTLSDGIVKSQYQPRFDASSSASEIGSFTSDDVHSITSEDLRDEEGDGFASTSVDLRPGIAPPPGFENVAVQTLENTRRLQQPPQIEKQEISAPVLDPGTRTSSSSDMGTNGSKTEEEEGGGEEVAEEEEAEEAEEEEGEEASFKPEKDHSFPPFINPPGVGLLCDTALSWDLNGNEGSAHRETDGSSLLLFRNMFQTGVQGVNEYDENLHTPFQGLKSSEQVHRETFGSADYDIDDIDEDDMIAEANRDALASDNDGWYGQEFGFYPTSSANSTYSAGGFFGIDLPKPGFIRNPSLTPISERSEGSLRNSLSIISPNSLHGGISAGPLSAALFTEIANDEGLNCDDATMAQLNLLSGARTNEENFGPLKPVTTPIQNAIPAANNHNSSNPSFNPSTCVHNQQHSFLATKDDPNHHVSEVSTSYVHDVDLGWVMEKRRGGELIQRELVRGAV